MSEALRLEDVGLRIGLFDLSLDLSIRKGELVALVGPSGCGKTTTIGLVSGLLAPDRGRILINGADVTTAEPDKRSAAVVFQDYALFPHMSVGDNIAFPLKLRKVPRPRREERVAELLEEVRLPGYGSRKPSELSGGEAQRIALARALAAEPAILLLDEPLSALDPALRKALRHEIRRIQKSLGQTTVYVTHDQDEALSISDRIIVMRDGRIEQFDTPWEVYNHPRTLFAANFMGGGNLIPASAAREARLVGPPPRTPFFERLEPGLRLFFRPEAATILDSKGDLDLFPALRLDGCRVVSSDYQGERWAVELDWRGLAIQAYSGREPREGTCAVSARLDKILLFNG